MRLLFDMHTYTFALLLFCNGLLRVQYIANQKPTKSPVKTHQCQLSKLEAQQDTPNIWIGMHTRCLHHSIHASRCRNCGLQQTLSKAANYGSDGLRPDPIAFGKLREKLMIVGSIPILSNTTQSAPDLQCKFENHWKPGLSRPGRPIVQVTADLGP